MSSVVSWTLHLNVREGRLDDLRSLVTEMVESTRGESGALAYEYFLTPDEKSCQIYERYADSAATLEHLKNFGAKFSDRFMACLEPTGFFVYGEPSADVRSVLDGFGAVYLGWMDGFAR